MTLGDKIKELCKEKRKTIKDLATDIDMTEVGFHQSMQRNSLKVATLEKVAAALDVPITYFFNKEENMAGEKRQGNKNHDISLNIRVGGKDEQRLLKRKAMEMLKKRLKNKSGVFFERITKMQNIKSVSELKNAILHLENDKKIRLQLLKEHFYLTQESLKPVNIIKNSFKETVSSPGFKNNVMTVLVGLAGGYLSKKLLVGASHNPLKKLLGAFIQLGVANTISKHPEMVESTGGILKKILSKISTRKRDE